MAQSCCLIKQFFPRNQGYREQAAVLFRQEVLRLKELSQHPQIPDFLDYFEYQSVPHANGDLSQFLVQEFIDGQNLAERLAEEGAFSETAIRQLLTELLPVIQFVHNHRVIHRDIKPENIICPRRGPVVLIDFGAAKLATATASQTGTSIGSAGFTAPEQLMGKAVFASDLYSLGPTCIHLLTQIPTFDLFDVNENAWVWRDYPMHPVTQGLGDLLDRLLQPTTKRRYQSVADVLQDLNPEPLQLTAPSSVTAGVLGEYPPWQCLHTLTGHSATVNTVALSPTARIFASGSDDQSIQLWHLDQGRRLRILSGLAAVRAVAISPGGKLLHTLSGHSGDVRSVAFSPDGKTLASGSGDDTLRLWQVETGACLHTIDVHSKGANSFTRSQCAVSSVAFHPHKQLLASSSDDKTIKLWNLQPVELVGTLSGHTDEVTSITISPDGKMLVSGSLDRTIKLWNLSTRNLLCTLTGHPRGINSVTTSSGDTLVSASLNDTLNLWSLKRRERLGTLTGHTRRIHAAAVSSDGTTVVSDSGDHTVKIWRRSSES